MALLSLSKCRLCLKLGDFYSIFAEDNTVQLARMVMACSQIQIEEGDGLPDKVCGECVEKLSAAYIFKQQCERSDAELRKSLNITGLTNQNEKTPRQQRSVKKKRKHNEISQMGNSNLLEERYSVSVSNTLSLEGTRSNTAKKRRLSESSYSSNVSAPTDKFDCKICKKKFTKLRSLNGHLRIHKGTVENDSSSVNQPYENENVQNGDLASNSHLREGEMFNCEKCGEQYHNKVLFNVHVEQCKEEDFDEKAAMYNMLKLVCPVCKNKYKKKIYLRKHLGRSACGFKLRNGIEGSDMQFFSKEDVAFLPKHSNPRSKNVQCSNCDSMFWSHSIMLRHFLKCLRDKGVNKIRCMTCGVNFTSKNYFYRHIKKIHLFCDVSVKKIVKVEAQNGLAPEGKANVNSLQCRKCNKTFDTQTKLVMHLAAHMANIDENVKRQPFKCSKCNKKFRYRAILRNHLKKCHNNLPADLSILDVPLKGNHCDLCGKSFKYAKTLVWHKNTKHPTIDDSLIALYKPGIEYSKCPAKCLHCDVVLDNEHETKMHNRMHIENNVKVKNEYTCPNCDLKFTNTKIFRLHIKEHNDNNADDDDDDGIFDASISNYCEVTSNLNRDSDTEVDIKPSLEFLPDHKPIVEEDGVTCSICGKKLDSLKGYHLHMRTHKYKPTFNMSCFICHGQFANKEGYQKHMRIHYNDDSLDPALLTCTICKRPSKNLRSYIAHMSWHTVNGRFKCYICSETFPYFKLYGNHMDSKHQINITECSVATSHQCHLCGKYFANDVSLQYHVLCHQQGEPPKDEKYECVPCKEKFTTKYQHVVHMQSHHHSYPGWEHLGLSKGKPKFPPKFKKKNKKMSKVACPVCDVVFISRVRFNRHLKSAHPVKKMVKKDDPDGVIPLKHICVMCGKEFSSDERLQFHLSMHKRKPELYKCTLCFKKSFSLKNHLFHLRGHLLKHHKDSPLECETCHSTFVRRQELRLHLQQAHNIIENYVTKVDRDEDWKPGELQEHQCHVCGKILRNQSTYNKHIFWHNTRRCNYCFTYFDKKTFLLAHVMYNCDKKKLVGNSDQFDKKLRCHICYKQFSIVVKLHCHLKVQHNMEPIGKGAVVKTSACDFCFSVFPSEERMLSHRKVHFYSSSMKCKICSKPFRVMSYFKNHKVRHYRQSYAKKPLSCEHCDEQFTTMYTYVKHLRVSHKLPMVWLVSEAMPLEECKICHKEFTHLERHMMYHEKYKCKKCNQFFLSEVLFNNHFCEIESEDETNIERREVPILNNVVEQVLPVESQVYSECEYCFKPISTFYTKTKHDANHSKVVYFCCRLCDRRFFMKSAFNVHSTAHRLQHFNKNPLRCRHCGESFNRYQHYTEHIRQVHDDPETMEFHLKPSQPRDCLICKKTFVNLHRHYKYHLALRCKHCLKYVLSEKMYKSHNCNDESEDQSMLVEFDGDISSLIDPDANEWETERMIEAIPRNEDFALSDDGDFKSNALLESVEHLNSESRSGSASVSEGYLTNISSFGHLTFDNFSPVISSTVSLSSSVVEKDKEDEVDIVNIQVKSEPIDPYYRDYGQYDFQNSLMDIDNPSG